MDLNLQTIHDANIKIFLEQTVWKKQSYYFNYSCYGKTQTNVICSHFPSILTTWNVFNENVDVQQHFNVDLGIIL